ncbi:MAG: murein L,D-transpeptidase [Streptosporangiales bacterium]|nr:murein L,D-transpeptidase [Streptosporangiales bacterium]MBO0892015.1 murein L,D-transpeptidase [Acidothermales bacterium]
MVRRTVVPGVVLAATALLAAACSPVPGKAGNRPAAATRSPAVARSGSSTPSATPSTASTSPGAPSKASATPSTPSTPATSPSTASASPSTSPSATPTRTRDPLDIGDTTFEIGARGDRVKALQLRLEKLHYDPGSVDGEYGPTTLMAVWAFQKVNGIEPTGTIGRRTRAAFEHPKRPKVLVHKGPGDRVEINLTKQILTVYDNDDVVLVSHTSSGTGRYYCDNWKDDDTGETGTSCGIAVTPTGDYRAGRRIAGWRHSKLGYLYNPVYFNGGIAVHGEPAVPLYPASHGCVRIPMHTSNIFPRIVGDGERIYVRHP